MAGQEQLFDYNKESLYNSYTEELRKQVNLKYMNSHFKIGDEYDRLKLMHSQLYSEAVCTDDCTLISWIDRKIKGKLTETKIKRKEGLNVLKEDKDIHIHNYYNLEKTWDEAEW